MSDFDWVFDEEREIETTRTVDSKAIRRESKRKLKTALKKEKAAAILDRLPERDESWHIISNGSFDYFNFLPLVIGYLGGYAEKVYGSTWTMNRENAIELFTLFDSAKIGKINILTGRYFKRRESAVYALLVEGLMERGQRYVSFRNHAKVMLLDYDEDYITIEGSANFTANPRVEQTVITNDRRLWEFHRDWMEEMLSNG